VFVKRFGTYVDELIEFPGYPGIPEREPALAEIPHFLASMQARSFDLALQMHGNGSITNPLLVLLGARMNAGFFVPGQFCPDERTFLPYTDSQPEVARYAGLVESLGIASTGCTLEFPLWKDDREELARLADIRGLWPGEYVCVHPGAHDPLRCWPVKHFAAVADALGTLGMSVVLTGSSAERGLTERVAQSMRCPAINLAGQTTLGALAVLLSNARLLVCNDTGVSHIAAALRVPSVVIFTNSDPGRWAPLDRNLHKPVVGVVRGSSRPTRRTVHASAMGDFSNGASHAGGREVALPTIEEVQAAAENLLSREKFYWHAG
jgi:ADP-heptose:LPS heptosyltransferase